MYVVHGSVLTKQALLHGAQIMSITCELIAQSPSQSAVVTAGYACLLNSLSPCCVTRVQAETLQTSSQYSSMHPQVNSAGHQSMVRYPTKL